MAHFNAIRGRDSQSRALLNVFNDPAQFSRLRSLKWPIRVRQKRWAFQYRTFRCACHVLPRSSEFASGSLQSLCRQRDRNARASWRFSESCKRHTRNIAVCL